MTCNKVYTRQHKSVAEADHDLKQKGKRISLTRRIAITESTILDR